MTLKVSDLLSDPHSCDDDLLKELFMEDDQKLIQGLFLPLNSMMMVSTGLIR